MKRLRFTIALLIGLQVSLTATAQDQHINIRVPHFARPLVEKWISEYTKTTPGIDFQLVSGKSSSETTPYSIQFVAGTPTTEDATETVYFGRYAVLPVTTSQSEAESLLAGHRLNAKRLKNLFFFKDDLEDDGKKETKAERALHIYTGNGTWSVSRAYATHFKHTVTDFKGKKISGDDTFLTTAISRDPLGVTVNTLSNLYDLHTRRLRSGLTLLPLELDGTGRKVLADGGQLDEIIQLLEQQQYDEIAVERFGVSYDRHNDQINAFVRWVLTDGSHYMHEYGLLELSPKELSAQLRRIQPRDIARK